MDRRARHCRAECGRHPRHTYISPHANHESQKTINSLYTALYMQVKGIAAGLFYLHSKGVVHSDMKSVSKRLLIVSDHTHTHIDQHPLYRTMFSSQHPAYLN